MCFDLIYTEWADADVSTAVISDPDDPQFDLEAYITMKTADEAK